MNLYAPLPPAELIQDPSTPFDHSFVSLEGFLNAKLMVEILQRLGAEPQRGRLEDAVFSVDNFDLGIGEQVSFSHDRRQGLQQVYYTVVDEGRFVPLDDWRSRFG